MSFTVNTCFRSTRSDLSMFQWVMLSVICQSFFFFCLAPGHKKMFLLLFLLKRQSHREVGCSTYLSTFPNGHTISQLGFCYILGSFLISVRVYAKAHYCACGCAIFPVLFVEKINMIPLICLCTFVKKINWPNLCGYISRLSTLPYWSLSIALSIRSFGNCGFLAKQLYKTAAQFLQLYW